MRKNQTTINLTAAGPQDDDPVGTIFQVDLSSRSSWVWKFFRLELCKEEGGWWGKYAISDHEVTKDNPHPKEPSHSTSVQPHSEKRQRELQNMLVDWPISDSRPLIIVWHPLFRRFINELDPAFIIPDVKLVKQIIHHAYNYCVPLLSWTRLIQIKSYIELLIVHLTTHENSDECKDEKLLREINLTQQEWILLKDLLQVLGPFAEATQYLGKEKMYTILCHYYPDPAPQELISALLDPRLKSLDFVSTMNKLATECALMNLYNKEKLLENEQISSGCEDQNYLIDNDQTDDYMIGNDLLYTPCLMKSLEKDDEQ
ncbi:647_t:CDS:2, partial [Dentiscutata erythropus]